uniref:Uncharacterized protein n=1 Tax=Cacopsylla melanoneura TaxID=428564 RepID=A0A8D8X8E3_9HEMI
MNCLPKPPPSLPPNVSWKENPRPSTLTLTSSSTKPRTQTSLPDVSDIPNEPINTFTSEVVITETIKKSGDRQSPKEESTEIVHDKQHSKKEKSKSPEKFEDASQKRPD